MAKQYERVHWQNGTVQNIICQFVAIRPHISDFSSQVFLENICKYMPIAGIENREKIITQSIFIFITGFA
jgi:hypothetical protein